MTIYHAVMSEYMFKLSISSWTVKMVISGIRVTLNSICVLTGTLNSTHVLTGTLNSTRVLLFMLEVRPSFMVPWKQWHHNDITCPKGSTVSIWNHNVHNDYVTVPDYRNVSWLGSFYHNIEIPLTNFVHIWYSNEMPVGLGACTIEFGSVTKYVDYGHFVTFVIIHCIRRSLYLL